MTPFEQLLAIAQGTGEVFDLSRKMIGIEQFGRSTRQDGSILNDRKTVAYSGGKGS